MTPSNLLQTLRDLDRTSPDFHNQLTDFLRGNEYRDVASSLQGEDLIWFVNYLDNVSLRTVSLRPMFTAGTGPLQHLRSQQCTVSGTARRTQKDMWYQEYSPGCVHSFRFAFGMRV